MTDRYDHLNECVLTEIKLKHEVYHSLEMGKFMVRFSTFGVEDATKLRDALLLAASKLTTDIEKLNSERAKVDAKEVPVG